MTSTALDRVDPIQALQEAPWIDQVNERQLALIQNTVAKGLSKPEVGQFLELARSLGMNPWAREIWAAKGKGHDGEGGQLLIMVGRDGLIGHAERNFADYRGYDSGVVYKNDDFTKGDPDPEAKALRARVGVVHRQAHPKDRGNVVGAWAVAERRDRPPRYFYAALDEYMPTSDGKRKYSPWGSAVAVMIEKVPISIVHRTLCGLGAVYLEEEVARAFDAEATVVEGPEELREAVLQHLPDSLKKRAFLALANMNELAPNSWTASKVEMVFKGKGEKEARAELYAVERAVGELRARQAQAPPEEGDGEEEIADAEVVDDHRKPLGDETWECPSCHRELLSGDEACNGALDEPDHPTGVKAVRVSRDPAAAEAGTVPERTPEEERKLVRIADLEDVIAEGGLSEQQKNDAIEEIGALGAEVRPDAPAPGQAELEL